MEIYDFQILANNRLCFQVFSEFDLKMKKRDFIFLYLFYAYEVRKLQFFSQPWRNLLSEFLIISDLQMSIFPTIMSSDFFYHFRRQD